MTTAKQYDYLNRLTGIASYGTGVQPVSFAHAHNAANQRTRATQADGEEPDVPPLGHGLDYYTFDVYDTKHRLWIRANGAICNFDNQLSKPTFCVGQNVTFTSDWEQTPPAIETTTSMWELGGTYVNDHTNAVSGGTMPSSAEIYFGIRRCS